MVSSSESNNLPQVESMLALVRAVLEDNKALNIAEIDVRGRTSIADFMVIASGTSDRHVRAIAGKLVEEAKHAGEQPLGVEGEVEGEWILVDLGDLLVHVMQPSIRDYYNLERFWQPEGAADAASPWPRGGG